MSYRIHEHPKPKARRTVEATATPMRVFIMNGTYADVAFPCFYQEVTRPVPAVHHNIHWHHHVGWPVYNHPDHICQMAYRPGQCGHHGGCKTCRHYLDASTVFPIHLAEEGYTEFHVAFDFNHIDKKLLQDDEGNPLDPYTEGWIGATPRIDDFEDWVVKTLFYADIDKHFDRPQRVPFVVRGYCPPYSPKPISRDDPPEHSIPPRMDTIAIGELIIYPAPHYDDPAPTAVM